MPKYNPTRAKVNRSYTFEELAAVYGVHTNTVALWVKNGLPCLKGQKPYLILGHDARDYLQALCRDRKRKCRVDEFYCVRCKKPRQPAENFAEFIPLNTENGRLVAICEHCEGLMNKFTSVAKIPALSRVLDLSVPIGLNNIMDIDKPV